MNILTIADQPQLFNSLQNFLSKNNCSVFFCRKQRGILSLIKKKDIRIIIMDLTLKEIQDFALLQLIKSFDPIIEVIIIGDSTTSDKIGESIRLGASEYITKPLRIQPVQLALKRINDLRFFFYHVIICYQIHI
ncbi:MAG: response regulator, partial [Candidatus Aminicenantaceae bacterium]